MYKCIGIIIVILTVQVFSETITYNCKTKNGESGLCQRSGICEVQSDKNRTVEIEPEICGMVNQYKHVIICCTDVNVYNKKSVNNSSVPGMEKHDKKCLGYYEELRILKKLRRIIESSNNIECSNGSCSYRDKLRKKPYILGGRNAQIDEFPHMARLGWEQVNENGYDWKCGGSLISEQYVLTAAHCLYIDDSELKTSEPTMIRLGESDPIQMKISSIVYHPNYNSSQKYNDIGLIKLEKPIEFSLNIYPACLYGNSILENSAMAIGWGYTTPEGNEAKQLQKVKLDFYEDQECKTNYPNSRSLPDGIAVSQFCAGYKLGGRDACRGDSGGPIQRRNKQDNAMFDVIGITSFGAGCGSSKGGVYTRVSHYIEWINQIVWPEEIVF